MRPSPELNDIVLGVLGRALSLYHVELYAFAVMSNHIHLLVSPADAEHLARFMQYLNSNLSREVGRLHGWTGAFWERRYRSIPVIDEESQVARLRYILSQGCKEGLVASPMDWPGANSTRALVEGTPLIGTWLDRSALYAAQRSRKHINRNEFATQYKISLKPLPCWAELSIAEYRQRCSELVADIERETEVRNAELGRQPVGRVFVLEQDPHDTPRGSKWSPAPIVHGATKAAREAFRSAYRRFVDAFRRAADRLKLGYRDAEFPPHSFPPALPFVLGAAVDQSVGAPRHSPRKGTARKQGRGRKGLEQSQICL